MFSFERFSWKRTVITTSDHQGLWACPGRLRGMRNWPDDVLAYGGDYNPEQWPREVWEETSR